MNGVCAQVARRQQLAAAPGPAMRASAARSPPCAALSSKRRIHMQHVLGRVVVHVAQLANVPIAGRKLQLLLVQHGPGLVHRPRKVVAVVVQPHIRVLRCIKAAALAVRHRRVQPAHNLLRRLQKILAHKTLEAMHVIAQQLGVVVEHLLKVRNHPALVHAVAMKSSGKLVVDAAPRHLLKRHDKGVAAPSSLSRFIATSSSRSSDAG